MTGAVADVVSDLEHCAILPVIMIDDPSRAVDLATALADGGIGCAEITLRTDAGVRAIAAIASALPDFVIGAGTVLSADAVDRVIDAGARFVVSPGLDDEVVERARNYGSLALPGVATASEVQRALRNGLDRLKFFPSEQLGGRAMIDALAAPFSSVQFVASGGVGIHNVSTYLESPAVFAVSGSWMATRSHIADADWDSVRRLAAEAVAVARNPA